MKRFALVGNPNSGKTTLFNSLTGSTAHVGNWPGVTVDKKDGTYKKLEEEISIIIITEKIADNIRGYINKRLGSDVLPMVIEIPDKTGSSEGGNDQMAALIKRVIGVEMVK